MDVTIGKLVIKDGRGSGQRVMSDSMLRRLSNWGETPQALRQVVGSYLPDRDTAKVDSKDVKQAVKALEDLKLNRKGEVYREAILFITQAWLAK